MLFSIETATLSNGLFATWKDKITNAEVRQRTGHGTLEVTLKIRRLQWLGHLHRMEDSRLRKQALDWFPPTRRKRRGRPQKRWRATVTSDLKASIDLTWDEAAQFALDRQQ